MGPGIRPTGAFILTLHDAPKSSFDQMCVCYDFMSAQVLAMLKSASDPSAIIQDCPELATPETLSRCLATIQSMHVGQDPVKVSNPMSSIDLATVFSVIRYEGF